MEIYVTIGKRNLCYYGNWDICVGKLHLAPPKEWSRGDGRIHQTYLNKTKSAFKCIPQIHALECKANFIDNYFSLFYINALRMSDSFADVMSSLYNTCKLPLVNKQVIIYIYI